MQVIACQFDIAWEDRQRNFGRVTELLSGQQVRPGSLIVLPEMFDTGFSRNVRAAADSEVKTRRFLADLARQTLGTIVAGVVDTDAEGRGLNQALVVGPKGNELLRYTKMHPFTPSGESDYYKAGDKVSVFNHAGFTIAPLVCYDLRFPERFRDAVKLGAQVMVVIANWPGTRAAHWTSLLIARAIENQAYVVGVNRVGSDPKLTYPGLSTIIDPKGNVLARADDQPTALAADIDKQQLVDYRRAYPFLNDMRD